MSTLLKWARLRNLSRVDNSSVTGPRPFDGLPDGVVGVIFGKLPIGDRVRTRLVCKSWRDKLIRADFPIKPEPPWLFLPNDSYNEPQCFQSEVRFQSMSERERIYRFKMPKSVYPGRWWRWCCCGGSNGGWLLMAGRQAGRDFRCTAMMLWDPISGATRRLPALSTLPFFAQLLDDWTRAGVEDISSVFTAPTQVFSVECVVAVVFVLGRNLDERRLALCSPEDQSWSVLPPGGGGRDGGLREDVEYHDDILFHNGKLYTVRSELVITGNADRSAVVTVQKTECTIRLSCCDVEVAMLVLKNHAQMEDPFYPVGFNTIQRWRVADHLVGSTTAGELLVVSAVLDMCTYSGVGCQGPIRSHACSKTRGFEVRRLCENNVNKGSCNLEKLTNIGEQCIYLGASGSTSIERVEEAPNCIHFAIDDADGTLGIDDVEDDDDDDDDVEFNPEKVYDIHERGVFYVQQDRIETTSFTNLRIHSGSCAGWFTPKLPS